MGKEQLQRFTCPYKRHDENCAVTGENNCGVVNASPNDRDAFIDETARLAKECVDNLYPSGSMTWHEGFNQSTENRVWDGNIEFSPARLKERTET